ncbi:MAG: hypothetical protein RIB58_00400 [Phycisphaerales bacterium]
MLNKAGTVLVSHKFTDPGFPFKRFGTGSGSVAPSRWFDARTDYQPSTGRQWISFSEQNAEFGSTGTNTISPLHLAVTKSPDVFPPGGLSNFGTGQWWYFTGNAGNPGNGGTAFNMQDTAMLRYPGGGPDNPFPDAPMVTPQRSPLFDLPIISIDEQAVYVTAFGTDADLISTNPDVYGPSYIFCGIYIIPVEFDDGTGPKSMLDGDQPGMGLVTSLRPRDLDEAQPQYERDFHVRHYPVQEPEHYPELENAQFFISVDESDSDVQRAVRLGGLWFDDSAPMAVDHRWRYTQQINPSTLLLDDLDVGGSLAFRYQTGGYDVQTPDSTFNPATVGAFISSAVLTKDSSGEFRIFATHHVYLDDGAGGVNGIAVQWYVIDPHLAEFRKLQSPPTWNPTIVASGRITTNGTNSGDCYHPVIGVTPQGVAVIEYTYSNANSWPQIRRATLSNTYSSVGSDVLVRPGPINYSYSPANDKWADFSDMQADPSGCRLWSVHTLVHDPGGPTPGMITTINERDVWVIEVPGNCNNANLNGDSQVDLYDMSMFTDLFATGARRVDMDTDGDTDSTDAALYQAAYDAAAGRRGLLLRVNANRAPRACSVLRRSRVAAIHDLVALALAAAADGVVLAQGMGGVVLPGQDAAQVGVAGEADAVHVEDLALGPFGSGPDVAHAVDHQAGVFLDAVGGQRGVDVGLDEEAVFGLGVGEVVDDGEASGLVAGVVEVIDACEVGQEVVAQRGLEVLEDGVGVLGLDEQARLASELGATELGAGEGFFDGLEVGVVERGGLRHVWPFGSQACVSGFGGLGR